MTTSDGPEKHLELIRSAWDAYQPAYMAFHLQERPDFFEYLAKGGIYLQEYEVRLAGDVTGLTVLDVCCASAADEAFSWENLGAEVVACDLSPVAIEIARENGKRLHSQIRFEVADAQELTPIESDSVDLLYGRYLVWYEDMEKTMRAWYRVIRPGGRLLLCTCHPMGWCLDPQADGSYRVGRSYGDESPDYQDFTGTDMADRHGGWGQQHPAVEFFHPTWRIFNAMLAAGFQLLWVEEPTEYGRSGEESDGELPHSLVVLARKPKIEAQAQAKTTRESVCLC